MFGFGKKKEPPPPRANRARRSEEFEERKAQSRAQLGFLVGIDDETGGGVPTGGSFDVDDTELENELLMLLGDSPVNKPKGSQLPASRQGPAGGARPKAPVAVGLDNLEFNINLEEGSGGHEDDDDVDLDDPELQAELGEILGDPMSTNLKAPPVLPEVDYDEPVAPSAVSAPTMTKEELIKLLDERLILYEKAKTSAEATGDSQKARRFTRGLRTLKELLSKAKSGRVVDESDIPPAVSLGVAAKPSVPVPLVPDTDHYLIPIDKPEPTLVIPKQTSLAIGGEEGEFGRLTPSPQPNLPEPLKPIPTSPRRPIQPVLLPIKPEPPIDYDTTTMERIKPPTVVAMDPQVDLRLKDYRKMAVVLKRNLDTQGALHYLKLSKGLEAAVNSGIPVDLSQFPELPSSLITTDTTLPVEKMDTPISSSEHHRHSDAPPDQTASDEQPPPSSLPTEDIFGAPPPPKSVMEALEQRLDKYKSEVEKANSSSNAGKARRMGRIVKQYEEAIVLYKKGKPVPFDELPTPPGFSPIPIPGGGSAAPPPPPPSATNPIQVNVRPSQPSDDRNSSSSVTPEKINRPGPGGGGGSVVSPGSSTGGSIINRATGKPVSQLTLQAKQLALVTLRQKQYRDGAVEAKKRGDINQAREYLRISKGMENLIEASRGGLPIDLSTLPAPPDAIAYLEAEDFEVVTEGDCIVPPSGNLTEIFAKLEEDLREQLKMCMRTREHFKNIGDVASANRFEGMAIETKKDLDALRLSAKSGQEAPKYHYENRIFSITECNTDVKDDEIEITVVRGVNLKGPSSLDTFVRVELAYPSVEEAQSQKSHVVKDSTDPEYNVTYKMIVNRTARNFQRFVHRHGVKIEVWSKGGFLRSSTLLGFATAKLQPLENKCNLHDAFEILDGRKVVGKLEVKIRIRDPVLTKQITQKKEKWLTIDRA